MKSKSKLIFFIFVFICFLFIGCDTPSNPSSGEGALESTTPTSSENQGISTSTTNPEFPNPPVTSVVTFTVSFVTEHGSLPVSIKNGIVINENSTLKTQDLPMLSAEGYSFGGWWDGETQVIPDVYKVTKDVTLTAKWTLTTVSYTVSFVSAHGSTPEAITLSENTVLMEDNAPTLFEEGYRFDGWYDGETKIEVGSYIIVKNIELTAKWIACWRIHFDSNGGTGTMSDQLMDGDGESHQIKKNTFVREGYIFTGWCDDYNSSKYGTIPEYNDEDFLHFFATDEPKEGSTLYAMWKPITYTVRFDTNRGVYEDFQVTYDEMHTYIFTGSNIPLNGEHISSWNTKPDGTGTSYSTRTGSSWGYVDFGDISTENNSINTLYAQWETNIYTILLKGTMGGVTNNGEDTVYIQCKYGESYTLSNPFIKSGYVLSTWYSSDLNPNFYDENCIVENLTPYHGKTITFETRWTDERYYINFNSNGGSGTIKYLYVRPDETVKLPSNKFTHSKGYTFLYWEGGYLEGESVCNLAKPGSYITLKAIWAVPGEIINIPISKAENILNKLKNNSRYKLSFYGEINDDRLSQIIDIIVSKNLSVDLHLEESIGLSKISDLSNCLWLKSLYLANETKIGVMALYGCNNLEGVYYPNYSEMNDNYYLAVSGNVPSNGTRWIALTSEDTKHFSLVSEKINLQKFATTSNVNNDFARLLTDKSDDGLINEFKGYEYEWQPVRK